VDESGEYLDVPIALQGGEWKEGTLQKFKIGGKGITGYVAEEKMPARIADVRAKGWWNAWYEEVYPDTRSELTVPMLDEKDELVGVINLESSRVGAFTEDDEQLLMAFAKQGVIARQSSKRYEAAERSKRELEVLARVSSAISSTLDLNTVLQLILEKAQELTGAPTGNIKLYDPKRSELYIVAEQGVMPEKRAWRQPISQGVMGMAAREQRPIRVDDVTAPKWRGVYLSTIPGSRSDLAVPMLRNEELVGVINVESPQVGAFGSDDERLLTALAGQAVIAVKNAELYRRARKGKEAVDALRKIDSAISKHQKLEQVLTLVLEEALQLTGAERGDFYLYHAYPGELEAWVSVDPIHVASAPVQSERFRFALEGPESITGRVAKTRRPYMSKGDVQLDETVRYVGYPDIHSEIAVPLVRGEVLEGVLNVESREYNAFDNDDLDLLVAFAGQAAIAIEDARNRVRFQVLFESGKRIIDAPLDIDGLLDIALAIGKERTEAHSLSARWWAEDKGELVARRRLGELHDRAWDPISLSDESANAWVAFHRQTLSIPDVEHPPEGVPFRPGHPATRSELIVPLLVGDEYFGNLDFGHPEINGFDAEEIKLVEGIAGQVAAAIQRVQQREENERINQRKQEAEYMGAIGVSLMEIVHKIGNSLGPIRTYVQEIREVLGTVDSEVNKRLEEILRDTNVALTLEKKLKEQRAKEMELSTEKHIIPARTILFEASRSYPMPENVTVEINCSDDIPAIEVDNRIHDAFANLFTNAVQAMQPQGGHIELGAKATNGEVEFWVKDDGPGIPRANQKSIFELFYSTKPEGIGFGLWSVRRNILANGGTIEVESDVGQGAIFKVRLPKQRG
jgi:GAF domain-containing protein